jgi:hypothetical protein
VVGSVVEQVLLVSTAFRQSAIGAVADLPGGSRGYQVLVAVDAGPPSRSWPWPSAWASTGPP